MPDCLIALGSNLGDRAALLDRAAALIGGHPGVQILARSARRETSPVGGPAGQEPFVNAALLGSADLTPAELLALLLDVEQQLGRRRAQRWSARPIDLDLLLYGDRIVATEQLTIPHPRMAFRRFVLEPAVEVAPDMVHPTSGWTIRQLLEHLNSSPDYVAIAGGVVDAPQHIALNAAQRSGLRALAADDSRQRLALLVATDESDRLPAVIDLARRRAESLRAAPSAPGGLVSDFWMGEYLALAEAVLAAEQIEQFREAWRQITAGLPRPKLLVVGDLAPHALQPNAISSRGEADEQMLARFHRCLRAQIAPPAPCPAFQLSLDDLPLAVDEVVAAIAAMQ